MTPAEKEKHPPRPELPHTSKRQRTEEHQDVIAGGTERALHIVEDVIYAFTALILAGGAIVVLVQAVYQFSTDVSDGVTKAIEHTLDSLLIVFILVELLAAVRLAILERRLVAEPFLLVGILAVIKEMVVVSTFRIERQRTPDTMLKIGVLGAVVIGLAVATWVLRRREREPEES